MKRRRSRMGHGALALAAASVLISAPTAAAGTVHDVSIAATPSSSGNISALTNDGSIRSTGPLANQHRAGFSYCTIWPNSKITGLYTTVARWHDIAHIGLMRTRGASTIWSATDANVPLRTPTSAWRDGEYGQCGTLEFIATGSRSHQGIWTAQLTRAKIEDLAGPTVTGLTTPTGWVTGNSFPVSFTTSDNGLGQDVVSAEVSGATTNLGDLTSGRHSRAVNLGSALDGTHGVTVTRRGTGWAPATATGTVRVDRNPPAAPTLTTALTRGHDGWIGTHGTVAALATHDAGSGWRHNMISVNGGAWFAGPDWGNLKSGVFAVRAYAEDNVGHRSAITTDTFKFDLTKPTAGLTVTPLDGNRGFVEVLASDAHSGVATWSLTNSAGGVLKTGTASEKFVLNGIVKGATYTLSVRDKVGHTASRARKVATPTVVLPGNPAQPAAAATKVTPTHFDKAPTPVTLGIPRRGLAGAIRNGSAPLPYWKRRIPGVGIKRAYATNPGIRLRLNGTNRTARIGKRKVPLITVAGNRTKRLVTGRFTTRSGSPIPSAYVIVRNPRGVITQTLTAKRKGTFRFTVNKRLQGKWTVAMWGRPERRFTIMVVPRSKLTTSLRKTTIKKRVLTVTGKVLPKKGNTRRLVQLQWLDGKKWKPIVSSRTNRQGKYRLRYRFRNRGGYAVHLRIVAPGHPGQASLRTRPRLVTVAP